MPQYELIKTFLQEEKQAILDATVDIREDRRKARRNYERKYDVPFDRNTGKEKLFMPLTTQEVNTIGVRYELPEESISITTNEPGLERKAIIWEELLTTQFKDMDWNHRIKAMRFSWVNEGNMVIEMYWNKEKGRPDFFQHDSKNAYIFPKELSIHDSSAFAIRKFTFLTDILADSRYENTDDLQGAQQDIVRDDQQNPSPSQEEEIGRSSYNTTLEFIELYERHGLFPEKFLMTDSELKSATEEEKETLVEGTLTMADPGGAQQIIEATEDSRKANFIEAWFNRRTYSWYGVGVGVLLRDYQRRYNKIVNRRDDNEDVLHHGMFKKKRGVTVDARQRQTSAGIFIETDDMAGLEQLRVQDVTPASYTGERNLLENVARINSTAELVRGGGTVNSASEAAIKDKNIQGRLGEAQGSLNHLFKLAIIQAMELNKKHATKAQIIKVTGRDEELAVFDDFKLKTVNAQRKKEGLAPVTEADMQAAMKKFDGARFLKLPNAKFLKGDFAVEVDLDASLIKDKAGLAALLIEAMGVAAQIPSVPETLDFADMFERWINLQGLKIKRREAPPPPPALPGGIAQPGVGGSPEEQAVAAAATASPLPA